MLVSRSRGHRSASARGAGRRANDAIFAREVAVEDTPSARSESASRAAVLAAAPEAAVSTVSASPPRTILDATAERAGSVSRAVLILPVPLLLSGFALPGIDVSNLGDRPS
jgi:hypothetical protein